MNRAAALACAGCERAPGPQDAVEVGGLELTASEWRTLRLSPLWVFFGVAGADGHLSDAEAAALRYRRRWPFDEPALLAAVAPLRDHLWELVALHDADGRGLRRGLRDVAALLARLPEERAGSLRVGLVKLGIAVASAGGFFDRARRVDDSEAAVLAEMAGLLGLSDGERRQAGLRVG